MFIFLIFSWIWADLIITSEVKTPTDKVKSITYISDSHFLVESPSRESALLYDGDNDQFVIIDHKGKKITSVYQRDLFHLARARAKAAANIKEIKKNISALYNEDLEKNIDEILKQSDLSYQKLNIEVKNEKDDRKWRKHTTKRFDASLDGKTLLSIWVLPYATLKLSADEMKSIVMNAKLLRFFIASMGQETPSSVEAAYLKIVEKERGVMVYSEQYGAFSKVEASASLIDFKRAKSVANKFILPNNYTKTNFVPK